VNGVNYVASNMPAIFSESDSEEKRANTGGSSECVQFYEKRGGEGKGASAQTL
jgi:hypothetical protein